MPANAPSTAPDSNITPPTLDDTKAALPLAHEAKHLVGRVVENPKTPPRLSIKKPLAYMPSNNGGEITPQSVGKQVGRPSKRLRKKSMTAVPKREKPAAPRKRRRIADDPDAPPPRRSARIAEKTATKINN